MSISKRLRYEILKRDGNKCRYCGATAEESPLTIDHVVPVALGGTDDPSNLVAACRDCNAGKSASSPDAELVEAVSEDALRWAQAHQVAARQMLADLEAREVDRQAFLRKWNSWKYNSGESVDLPGNWAPSVDQFVSAGLPLPVLLDCVDRAMGNEKIRRGDTFRYMCGIAWKRVAELRELTAAGLRSPAVASSTVPNPWRDAIGLLTGAVTCNLTNDTIKDLAGEFLELHQDDDEASRYATWSEELLGVTQAISNDLDAAYEWRACVRRVLKICSPPGGNTWVRYAWEKYSRDDPEMDDATAERLALSLLVAELVKGYDPDRSNQRQPLEV